MKSLALAALAAAGLALSMPAQAHMNCGWQWPNDDVNINTRHPHFRGSDCMAEQLNRQIRMGNDAVDMR